MFDTHNNILTMICSSCGEKESVMFESIRELQAWTPEHNGWQQKYANKSREYYCPNCRDDVK